MSEKNKVVEFKKPLTKTKLLKENTLLANKILLLNEMVEEGVINPKERLKMVRNLMKQ